MRHARYFLQLLEAENRKSGSRDLVAAEAIIWACLGAAYAAVKRAEASVGDSSVVKTKRGKWRAKIGSNDCKFYDRMMQLRGTDIHAKEIKMPLKEIPVPAPRQGPKPWEGEAVPMEVKGQIQWSEVWGFSQEHQLGEGSAGDTCPRFLDIVDSLIEAYEA